MNPVHWITRLRSELGDTVRGVEGAANFATASRTIKTTPYLWVVPLNVKAYDNELINEVSQLVVSSIGIICAIRNVSDSLGGAAQDELIDVRQAYFDVLLGWTPDDAAHPVEYSRGSLMGFSESILWWIDEFSAGEYIRTI